MEAKTKILPGQKYGRLMVLSKTGSRKWGQVVWRCRCSCKAAKDVDVTSRNLKSGRTTSCGCALSDLLRERNRKTGWHDLSREIAELASAHEAAIELLTGDITWNTKLVVRGRCGHERRTNVSAFLQSPAACRRCNKRLSPDALAQVLANRGILLQHIDYDSNLQGRSIGHCECKICHFKFSRTVGELSSGNRGCPNCTNIQEMYVRTIFAHNFGGTFQIRVRPKWMRGMELDGWNEEVSIKGRTVAFEYNGKYWHRSDVSDTSKSEQKKVLCNANGVLLLVVWAPADRPTMEELLVSCQAAIDEAGVIHRLELPPNTKVEQLASVLPQKLRARLLAMDHDPIGYDTDPSRRGYIRSRCRRSNQEVSQAAYSLKAVRGCKFCEAHVSNAPVRKLKARTAAAAGWESRRGSGTRRAHDKITDEIVRFVRKNSSVTETELSEEVERCFGVRISPSGLGYARSGKTHSHLNDKYPPIRKTASNYDQDHPAVKLAIELRDQGLSLNRIASRLFEEHHSTLKGTKFAAAQIKNFLRFAGPVQRNYSDHESRTLRNGDLSMG